MLEIFSNSTFLLNILPELPTGTPNQLAADGISFFSTWITRIGGLIAFIGAIKLAISIKDDNAKEQLPAILVMVSGFMIKAAVNDMSLFNIPAAYSEAAANKEFQSILTFIGTWVRRVGAFGMFIGAVMVGFAMKDNDAGQKVNGLRTLASGGIVAAVSSILSSFV